MSCTAMANETWASNCLSSFCGTANASPQSVCSCTKGKSAAGRCCNVKRLLPALSVTLPPLSSSVTCWSGAMVRNMSCSLRADKVVVWLSLSPPSSAWVRICTSKSLLVSSIDGPVLVSNTLAKMGSV